MAARGVRRPDLPELPAQDYGTRRARALPYELHVHATPWGAAKNFAVRSSALVLAGSTLPW